VRPIILSPSTVEGFVYWTSHNGSAYNPLTDPLADGAQVTLSGLNLTTLSTTTDASGAFVFSNVPPSVYQVAIRIHGSNFSAAQVTALPGKTVNETTGLSLGQVLGTVTDPRGTPIAGATVSVTGLSGTVGTNSTNASGKFRIDELGVGNYTVQASVPTLGLLSQPVRAALSKEGANATVELRLAETVPVSVTVTQNGQPVGAIPVRFTLIVPPGANPNTGNNSSAQASVESQEKANTSVVLTGPGGFAETDLPAGNYSVYALGYNGSTPYAAFWSGSLAPGASTVPTLALRPAQELSGKVTVTTAAPLTAPIEVAAYDPSGHVAWAFTNTTQHWALWLPSGPYTIVASSNAPFQSTILTLDVTGPTDLSFNLSLGILAKVSVHSSASSAPIANAQVALNLVPQGAQLTAPTDASGVAAFLLPGLVPPGASFCVNASATGYGSASACGLSPGAVANHSVVLSPSPVPVSVAVSGVPSGTPVQVNLTSTCSCAPSKTLSGLAPFNIALAPANYSVTAWAPNYPGGLERPPAPINWSVPIGATGLRFNVPLLHQVLARGTLSTPSGVPIPNVEVQLSSSAMSEAVRGGAFVNGFLVAPGTYQYFASAAGARPSTGWVAFGSLNVNGSGGVSPTIDVNGAAVPVSGTVHLPNGAVLSQGFTATFVTASGFPLRIDGTAGTFATELPVNGTFAEFLNMTSSLLVHNTSVLYQLALPTHAVCTTRTASAICDLALIGQPASVGFSGQLSALTSPSGIAGHLLFVGPQPSTNRTEASSSSDGRFSLSLPPGDYDLYANAASGGFALNERITIGQANETNVSLVLLKAWTATLTVLPPSGEIVGGANVTFQAFGAPPVVFPMTAGSGPYSLALPPESYVVNVSAPSDPFGVPTNATAGVTLPMSNGNAAATLKLSDDLLRTASLSFTLGDVPANITLPPSGGVVSLGFVVHNTGNAPESLVLSASPSTWNYTLRPSHVDLGVLGGSATASGTLIVRVPAGTPVAHPLLVLTAELNGTSKVAGHSVLPPPIAILPAPGVELGPSPTVEPIVSTSSVTVALFVRNTG
ncbi:MAG TPA: carboxypeptidase regulatory-like domain-containing protein, partial [Thermoplasmata archaeon]|nr:carboxypeptidase regulatory-like domain-containing protein [Thermoplasmata archaeon]